MAGDTKNANSNSIALPEGILWQIGNCADAVCALATAYGIKRTFSRNSLALNDSDAPEVNKLSIQHPRGSPGIDTLREMHFRQ